MFSCAKISMPRCRSYEMASSYGIFLRRARYPTPFQSANLLQSIEIRQIPMLRVLGADDKDLFYCSWT